MTMAHSVQRLVATAALALALALACAAQTSVVVQKVSMKVLVLGTVPETDATLGGITGALRARGAPYDYVNVRDGYANNEPLPLESGDRGNYYAVVKMSRQLAYEAAPGFWPSALSEEQWAALDAYAVKYNVRTLSVHSWPFFSGATFHSGGATGYVQYTGLHQQLDPALATDARLSLTGSYVTPANLDAAPEFEATAFLYADADTVTANGVAAAIHTEPATQRETWHFFFIPTPYYAGQVAAMQVAVNWVTRGMYLGQRRLYLSMQIDDLFLSTGEWDLEFAGNDDQSIRPQVRVTADEMQLLKESQEWLTSLLPPDSLIQYEWAYNGEGIVLNGGYDVDPLCAQTRANTDDFWYLSHTYTHPFLDDYNYRQCLEELTQNWDAADLIWPAGRPDTLGAHEMVNPAITGLFNANCLRAMKDAGIVTVVGDNSRAELLPDDVYHGLYTTVEANGYAGTFIIPRWATNIFFDNSMPETNLRRFNYITPYDWTWEELMTYESTTAARNLVQNRPDPFMFHQGNVHAFPWPGWDARNASLLTLWTKGVIDELNKYNAFPVRSLQQKEMRVQLEARMARDACGLDVYQVLENGVATRLHATSTGNCTLAVSGIAGSLERPSETYGQQWGGERTVYAPIAPGQEVVLDTGLVAAPTCPMVDGELCAGNGHCDAATNPPTCICDTGFSGSNCTTQTLSWLGNRLLNGDFEAGTATTADSWGNFGAGYAVVDGPDAGDRYITFSNADASAAAGAYQFVTLGQVSATALRIQARSRARGVSGVQDGNYAVYVDAVYADGTWQYGLTAQFDPAVDGTWQEASIIFSPSQPVAYLWVYTMFRFHGGDADFDDVFVQEAEQLVGTLSVSTDGRCGSNSPTNARCPDDAPCCSTFGWCGTGAGHCTYAGDDSSASASASGSGSDSPTERCATCTSGSGYCKHPDGWCTDVNELGACPAGTVACGDMQALSTGDGDAVVLTLSVQGIQRQALSDQLQGRMEDAVAAATNTPAERVHTTYVEDGAEGTQNCRVQMVLVAEPGASGADLAAVATAAVRSGALDRELELHQVGVNAALGTEPRVAQADSSGTDGVPAVGLAVMIAAVAVALVLGVAIGAIVMRRRGFGAGPAGGRGRGKKGRGTGNEVVRMDADDHALWANVSHVRLPQHSDSARRASDASEASEDSSVADAYAARRVSESSQRRLVYTGASAADRRVSAASAATHEEPTLIGTPRPSVTETDVRPAIASTRVADV